MFKHSLAAATILLGGLVSASPARADLVVISLQQAGVNGGTAQEVAFASGGALYNNTYGAFSVFVAGTGSPPLPEPKLSSAMRVSTTATGVLTIYITEQDVSGPLGTYPMQNYFAASALSGNVSSVVESTYLSTGNALNTGTLLQTTTFTASGSVTVNANTPDITSGPYSITETYTITSTTGGSAADGAISTSAVPAPVPAPEPGSFLLLGSGLLGLGLVMRRRPSV